MDNGVEKVVSSPGTAADVIIVNAADGTKAAYKNFSDFSGNFQDIEPLIANGAVTGYGVTGLHFGYTVPKGEGGCMSNSGCGSIFGHTSLIKENESLYLNLFKLSYSMVFSLYYGRTTASDL